MARPSVTLISSYSEARRVLMEQASEYGLTSGPKNALRAREPLGKVLISLEYRLFECLVE